MKYIFPTEEYGQQCVIVPIDAALLPFISGVLTKFFTPYVWETRSDYEQGYKAFAELVANMNNNCLQQLTEGQDRLYRLFDNWLNGTQYAVVEGQITPPIPLAPPANSTAANAARAQLRRLHQLAENAATAAAYDADSAMEGTTALDYDGSWTARLLALQGTTGGFFGIGETPVTLAQLLQAGRVNTPADEGFINDGVEEVLQAISQGTGIGGVIAQLLGTGAEIATDGGLAAVQIAVATAQAAAAAAQLQLTQRLIAALDGGAIGSGPADENNNVLSLLDKGLFADSADLGDGQGSSFGVVRYLLSRLGETDTTSPQSHLSAISSRIGPPVDGRTANEQLDAIRAAIRSLAGLEAAGAIAAGSALQLQLAVLECICEGVSGTPATFPPFEVSACNASFDLVASVPLVPFDSQGIAAPLEFVLEPGVTLTTVDVPGEGLCLFVGAARELCFQVVRAGGEPNEAIFGFVCTPFKFDGSGGARPTVQFSGVSNGESGFFETESSDDQTAIAYYITLAQGFQQPVIGQYRVYVAGGPVG